MSSKFFTWTKGDRRNATDALRSEGVVPIPVECLKIKGMDYGRSGKGKNHKKPLSLPLDQSPYSMSSYSNRTSDSNALHDAAVQSATSLMAVMNDMLRSPQLSAHISSQRRSDLTPMYARPRSHTAPSTPLVEAPAREPAELPGSLPLDLRKPHLSLPYGIKNSSDSALVRPHDANNLGVPIVRPHSSPQEKHDTSFFAAQPCADTLASDKNAFFPSAPETPRFKGTDLHRLPQYDSGSINHDTGGENLAGSDATSMASSKRPSLSVVQRQRSLSPYFAESVASSHGGSSMTVSQIGDTSTQIMPDDTESVLLEEIARLRSSQDAHVCSLKEAHEKELACQRSYIAFLEKRRIPNAHNLLQQPQRLTIDTSQSGSRTELNSEPSATTLKSLESCFDSQKRASQEAVAEVEALKRKLSLCRKAQVDGVEIRKERDHLRESADRSDRRIIQLKDIVRKAKENEKALRNQTMSLEARLVDANNERADVLEGFHDACSQVRTANERERRLAQELDDLRGRAPHQLEEPETLRPGDFPSTTKPKHGRTVSDAGIWGSTPTRMDPTMRQLIESRRMLAAKDARISELECAASQLAEQDGRQDNQKDMLRRLENQFEEQNEQLRASRIDAERYNSLLHNELRRQARSAAQNADKMTPQIDAEAHMVAKEKMTRLRNQAASAQLGTGDATSSLLPAESSTVVDAAMLEKELDHCIKEIIMYKLDIKGRSFATSAKFHGRRADFVLLVGYRKDVKKANAEIDSLRTKSMRGPPTPNPESLPTVPRQRSDKTASISRDDGVDRSAEMNISCDPGLGITLPQPPKTPTKTTTIAAATAAALSSPLASPPLRAKTPLNAHKKLPKPPGPSRTPSPLPSATKPKWPEQDITRTETLRSLSESIISSYAKRDRVEPEVAVVEPTSEPLGTVASLRTPARPIKEGRNDSAYAV